MLLSKGHIQRIIKEAKVVRGLMNRVESRVVSQADDEARMTSCERGRRRFTTQLLVGSPI